MSIEHFFNQAIVIVRQEDIGSGKTNYVSTGTYDAHVQQIQDIQSDSGEYASPSVSHKAWTDVNADISVGDRVIDASGTEYDVVGVNEEEKGIAMNEHKAVYLSIKK